MTDPIADLRRQLVGAAERLAVSETPARRRRVGRLSALALTGALVAGTAAAAILSGGHPSSPLAGPVPGASDTRYRIEIQPDLRAGAVGWCGSVRFTGLSAARGISQGCGNAAPRQAHTIAGAVIAVAPKRALSFVITASDVPTARRGDGALIATRPDRRLPFGWRAAVAPFRMTSGHLGPAVFKRYALRPADGGGRPLPTTPASDYVASQAAGPLCRVVGGPTPTSVSSSGRQPTRQMGFQGRPFRSCWHARYADGAEAALLVDAVDPARAAADLPGARLLRDGRVVAAGGLLARRAGAGWLVVHDRPAAKRAALLSQLSVG